MSKKFAIIACVLAFVAGRITADYLGSPSKDRPVLAAIVRFAKTALWFAAFAEPAPADDTEPQHVMVDDRGYARLDHSRGW